MSQTRRQVLKLIAATAAGGTALAILKPLAKAITGNQNAPPVIWVSDDAPELNMLAQLGQISPAFLDLMLLHLRLEPFDPLLPTGGADNPGPFDKAPILILESLADLEILQNGTIPLVKWIEQAKAVILLGTDACFGALRYTREQVVALEALCVRSDTPIIKLPGIPVPPHHMLGTLAHLEYAGIPELDAFSRPLMYYGETVCQRCERRGDLEQGRFADYPGDSGCLWQVGCKGITTHNSCSRVHWNEGRSWCVTAGAPCIGCSAPEFPHHGGIGLFGQEPQAPSTLEMTPLQALHQGGVIVLGLSALGVAVHSASRLVASRESRNQPPAKEPRR